MRESPEESVRGQTGFLEDVRKVWTGACGAEVTLNIFLLHVHTFLVNFYSLASVSAAGRLTHSDTSHFNSMED